jgi:hypothetical protein
MNIIDKYTIMDFSVLQILMYSTYTQNEDFESPPQGKLKL